MDVVTDKTLLICMHYTKWGQWNFYITCIFKIRENTVFIYLFIYKKIIYFYRDVRGFAIKFYSEDGIWDLVGLHSPTFIINDPMLFPSAVHSFKRNPVTNIKVRILLELQL